MSTRSPIRVPTADEIRAWPVTVDVPTAGPAWGLGRDTSYDLARQGAFPVPVLRLGSKLRVTRASVLAALGIPETPPAAPSNSLASGQSSQVGDSASDDRSEGQRSVRAA